MLVGTEVFESQDVQSYVTDYLSSDGKVTSKEVSQWLRYPLKYN